MKKYRNKETGKKDDLLGAILSDSDFSLTKEELDQILSVDLFIGRAPQQVADFLDQEVNPRLETFTKSEVPSHSISI